MIKYIFLILLFLICSSAVAFSQTINIEAETFPTKIGSCGITGEVPGSENICGGGNYGYIESPITAPVIGTYTFVVSAAGQDAPSGTMPIMELFIDGIIVGQALIRTPALALSNYTFTFNLPMGPHVLRIYFANDFYDPVTMDDRNLYVDKVTITHVPTPSAPSISLAWDPNTESNLIGYNVYRTELDGVYGASSNTIPLTTNMFTDVTVLSGRTYYYVVKALGRDLNNATVISQPSNQVQAIVGTPPVPNAAPMVNAGIDQVITLPALASLLGVVTDDGLPTGSLTTSWTKVSGPGTVVFTTPVQPATMASFSMEGVYVLRFSASDSSLSASDDVTVTVHPPVPQPPKNLTIVQLTEPQNNAVLRPRNPNTSVTITARASDETAVTKMEVYAGTTLLSSNTGRDQISTRWRPWPYRGMVVALRAKAYDGDGNQAEHGITVSVR